MRKRIIFYGLAIFVGMLAIHQADAQKSKKQKPAGKPLPVKSLPAVDIVLGHTSLSNSTLPKRVFDSLAKQRIAAPAGGTIQGFTFTYAEHNLYEDSVGNPLPLTDYLVEYCTGDSLTQGIRSTLFDRTKPGDTAYFSEIKVLLPNGQQATGKTMKFPISR
jgi:hypothetical protein